MHEKHLVITGQPITKKNSQVIRCVQWPGSRESAVLAQGPTAAGNDVSLYSSALGAYFAGRSFHLVVQEEKFTWLEPYLADEETKAATLP